MEFFKQLKAFEDFTECNYMTSIEKLLWYELMNINNRFNWSEWFYSSNQHVMAKASIGNENTLIRARNKLKQLNLIDFISGKKGQPTNYKIIKLYLKNTSNIVGDISVKEDCTSNIVGNMSGKMSVNMSVKTSAIVPDNKDYKTKTKTKDIDFIKEKQEKESLFSLFWNAYPRKTAKGEALKAWKKIKNMNQDLLDEIIAGIEKYKKSSVWSSLQFIPHPATFLNQERWKDEIDQSVNKVNVPSQLQVVKSAIDMLDDMPMYKNTGGDNDRE